MPKINNSFYNIIPKLSRDPLGIIALFIALTYAIAALVLGFGSHLTATQKWPLLGFLVGFPVIVLFSFLWLVVKYNQKLYAPEDYRSDKAFLKTLQPGKQVWDEDEEVSSDASDNNNGPHAHKAIKKKPEIQKYRSALSEDLALRELEIQMDSSFWRQLGISPNVDEEPVPFSALAVMPEEIIAVDIKFMDKEKGTFAHFYSQIKQKIRYVRNTNIKRPISGILVMITRNYSNKQMQMMEKKLKHAKPNGDMNVRVQWYDINDLFAKYNLK